MAAQEINQKTFDVNKYELRQNKTYSLHNQELFTLIKYCLKKYRESEYKEPHYLAITRVISEISNNDLLVKTLKLFDKIDFLPVLKNIILKKELYEIKYTNEEFIRVKSIVCAVFIRYEYLKSLEIDQKLYKPFSFDLKEKLVIFSDNYNVQEKVRKHFILNSDKFLKSKIEFETLIEDLRYEDYVNSSNNFQNEITYLEHNKNKLIVSKDVQSFKHPRIFTYKNDFKCFEFFKKLQSDLIKNEHSDYSFIYRQMIIDSLIYERVGDAEYRDWLNKTFQITIEKTRQYHICKTDIKLRLYNSLKDSMQ